MPANPSLQPEDGAAILGQLVVSPPAAHVLPPGVPQLFTGFALATSPQLPHSRFESLQAFWSRFDLPFTVQSKSQGFRRKRDCDFPDPDTVAGLPHQPAASTAGMLWPVITTSSPGRRSRPAATMLIASVALCVRASSSLPQPRKRREFRPVLVQRFVTPARVLFHGQGGGTIQVFRYALQSGRRNWSARTRPQKASEGVRIARTQARVRQRGNRGGSLARGNPEYRCGVTNLRSSADLKPECPV